MAVAIWLGLEGVVELAFPFSSVAPRLLTAEVVAVMVDCLQTSATARKLNMESRAFFKGTLRVQAWLHVVRHVVKVVLVSALCIS